MPFTWDAGASSFVTVPGGSPGTVARPPTARSVTVSACAATVISRQTASVPVATATRTQCNPPGISVWSRSASGGTAMVTIPDASSPSVPSSTPSTGNGTQSLPRR